MSAYGGPAVVVHGGASASMTDVDGCQAAACAAIGALRGGGDGLAAVVRAVVTLEDDGRFNAGSGAVPGLDGITSEMDAAIMDTRGRLGAVACIQRVQNPVLVARAVADSPHRLLCGEGAERFARLIGMAPVFPLRESARRRREEAFSNLLAQLANAPTAEQSAVLRKWNYPTAPPPAGNQNCDTVGAVARDADGHFAVAGSTGGVAPAMMGRVGDTPLIGAGFYAGPDGAVAATGAGEQIIPLLLAHTVYQWISNGTPLHQALQRGVALLAADVDVGLIAVSRTESGHFSNRSMPTSTMSYDE